MSKKFSRLIRFWVALRGLLEDRWQPEVLDSKWRRFVHFWVMVWRSFSRNRCPVRASALAYATLLALVPMLAVVMSITSTFLKKEGEEHIDKVIVSLVAAVMPPAEMSTNSPAIPPAPRQGEEQNAAPTEEPPASPDNAAAAGQTNVTERVVPAFVQDPQVMKVRKDVARNIHSFIQNTRSGALGVTGTVLLIFVAISMLSRIETTFNDIWGVARGRSWFHRIVTYWAVISLAPLLTVVALGLASGPHLESTRRFVSALPHIGNLMVLLGFQLLPIILLCLSFATFYKLIPNTKVQWGAALAGGLAGGLLFHLNNLLNVLYVSRVVTNSKIYGSLALVPVFMIGLYFAWLILLFGAQVAYAWQNRAGYLEEKQVETINQRGREFVALRLMTLIGRRFTAGETPPSVVEMTSELGVPGRLIRQVLQTLSAARLVVETAGADTAFMPSRPLETITCHDILLAMRATQGQELATREEPTRAEVYGEFQRIQEAERQAASSVSMLALVHRAQAQLGTPATVQPLTAGEPPEK